MKVSAGLVKGGLFAVFILTIVTCASNLSAAVIPSPATGSYYTRLDFCQADGVLYCFNGLNLYKYEPNSNSFVVDVAAVGSATTKAWDPADFAFTTDGNSAALPTGWSAGFVEVNMLTGAAQAKTGLTRNYYSIASAFRSDRLFANCEVSGSPNTLFMVDLTGSGTDREIARVSAYSSGAVALDAADSIYLSDFNWFTDGSGLGEVDIYRISQRQVEDFLEDSNSAVVPQLLVNNAILAGCDALVIDGAYDIYVSSYVGIARITPTPDPNAFTVATVDGDIIANPWLMPDSVFCGITADIETGIMYYGKSSGNNPYQLCTTAIEPVTDWSADLSGDGIVDYCDLQLWTEDYCGQGAYLKGDLNRDGIVNTKDFAVFANQWQNETPWH